MTDVMRNTYRALSDEEKQLMKEVKDLGAAFVSKLHKIGGTVVDGERLASRELSLAQTKAEEAVMWAVKHITA